MIYVTVQLQANSYDADAYQMALSLRPLYLIFGFIIFLTSLTLAVRRLRDAGLHWAYLFVSLIPYVGWIIELILMLLPSNHDAEK